MIAAPAVLRRPAQPQRSSRCESDGTHFPPPSRERREERCGASTFSRIAPLIGASAVVLGQTGLSGQPLPERPGGSGPVQLSKPRFEPAA